MGMGHAHVAMHMITKSALASGAPLSRQPLFIIKVVAVLQYMQHAARASSITLVQDNLWPAGTHLTLSLPTQNVELCSKEWFARSAKGTIRVRPSPLMVSLNVRLRTCMHAHSDACKMCESFMRWA